MSVDHSITYWDRARRSEETEVVYGDALVRWLYGTRPGQTLADRVLSRRLVSQAYGAYQSSPLSRRRIEPFIREFRIPMGEYEDPGFRSFNEFFIRRFRPGAREFVSEPGRMPAFAEARYLAYERVDPGQTFPVKGAELSPAALLGSEARARRFAGGSLLIARLCPVDYHRFHYPDDGLTLEHYLIPGAFHSVNPLALRYRGEIFSTNERQATILETRHFGKLAYIEVGAMCVGRIVQTHPPAEPFARGDEKGYFLFGASTVIVLGEAGAWKPDEDLMQQTARHRESLVRLGEGVARAG